jgi:hypothetical protein
MTDTTPTDTPPARKTALRRFITPGLAVLAALAIGVFGGILISHGTSGTTQASSTQRGTFGGAEGGGTPGGTGATGGGNFTSGTISAVDGDTVTLTLTDGSTVKVKTSTDTTVTKSDTAAVTDLKKGETVTVIGTTDSSGNVTATTVTEGATGGFGGGTPPSGTNG